MFWGREQNRASGPFTLVTTVHPTTADRYFVRDIFRTYQGFNRFFKIIDIRDYRANENDANVTIIDRFAMFMALYYEHVPYETLLEGLAGTKNLVFMTSDLHSWSIFPDLHSADLATSDLNLHSNNYDRLFQMFDRLEIRHLITCYDCPELTQITSLRPDLKTYVINLHVDTNIFKDHGLTKTHDVIIYGSTIQSAYSFRRRMAQLLLESGKFKVLKLELNQQLYDKENCGEGLACKINQSWLGLATVTTFDYLVGKYFEISACRSVVLGDMNEQGRAIFGSRYVHVDEKMSDAQILSIVECALDNREWLREQADHMYRVMHAEYTLADNERKLFQIANAIANEAGAGSPAIIR